MAYIDKIYGTKNQWIELHDFLKKNKREYIKKYLYDCPEVEGPISNFSREADFWMMENCPLDFVQERLKEQYEFFNDYYHYLGFKPNPFEE